MSLLSTGCLDDVPAEGDSDGPGTDQDDNDEPATDHAGNVNSGVEMFAELGLPPDVEAAWAEAEEEASAAHDLPFFDHRTYQVHDGPNSSAPIIGRIKPVREGTPSECISVYCRRHGCSKMVRVKHMPSQAAILNWFKICLDPGPKHKAAHMRAWPQQVS